MMAIGAAIIIQHTAIVASQKMSGETETQVLGFCETEGDCGGNPDFDDSDWIHSDGYTSSFFICDKSRNIGIIIFQNYNP